MAYHQYCVKARGHINKDSKNQNYICFEIGGMLCKILVFLYLSQEHTQAFS